jgi:hypothetical protein
MLFKIYHYKTRKLLYYKYIFSPINTIFFRIFTMYTKQENSCTTNTLFSDESNNIIYKV